jgi:hypothetical protein
MAWLTPGGADRVERVHGRDQPEPAVGADQAQPGNRDLALGQHRDQDVQRLLGDPVELLQVQQRAAAHGGQQRAVGEAGAHVALGQHLGRVVLAHQPGRGQLGVALGEHHLLTGLAGDIAQQRRLPGARRALDHDVPPGGQRDRQHLALAAQADDRHRARY